MSRSTPLGSARSPSSRRPRWLRHVWTGLLIPTFSFAQVIWDNNNGTGNSQWTSANNWNPNGVPGNTADIVFNGTEGTDATVNDVELRGNRTVNSMAFTNVDDAFSLVNGTGNRTLTITSGDITRNAGSSGVQTLAFSTLALGGASAMDIAGTGSLNISAAITGTGISLTKTGVGELVLSGTNTFSGGTIINAGTLTVQSASALGSGTTVTLGGGRLRLDTATTTITNLNLTASSIIDFATAATLNVTTLNLNGFTLTVENWAAASDHFFATNWTGATQDVEGIAPLTSVVFSGASGNTMWKSIDDQITVVPEPSTYGLLLFGALAGFFAWRRLVRRSAR
jgi:autotransporter-associated beta strand protein